MFNMQETPTTWWTVLVFAMGNSPCEGEGGQETSEREGPKGCYVILFSA